MGMTAIMFPMTSGQFDLIYNSLSFTLASMGASTFFFWLRLGSVHEKYKSAMTITCVASLHLTRVFHLFATVRMLLMCVLCLRSGLVTFIALYHYIRIFNSWTESYEFPKSIDGATQDPVLTGQPFNDAYRYMDWLLTVPLLLIEIVFVMKLSEEDTTRMATNLGIASGLMIILGTNCERTRDPATAILCRLRPRV